MKKVKIEDVQIGAILMEPVYIGDTLLCKQGTPMSAHLKEFLEKFGIKEVLVEAVFNENIDTMLQFDCLNQLTYIAVKRLDLNKVMLCAREMVNSLTSGKYNSILSILYEYDNDTYQHSLNVANLALTVGIQMGLSIQDLRNLAAGAILHDIGKTAIPLTILNKPGKLTDEEYEIMQKHTTIGYELIKDSDIVNEPIKQIVLQHHENYDGSGYPRNLVERGSYRLARLVHICDVYEALSAKRPYKEPIPRLTVRKIMEDSSGKMFDPTLLKAFMKCVPIYMIGEEIIFMGKVGVICDSSDLFNPMVYYNNKSVPLSEFEKITEDTIAYGKSFLNNI